MSSFERSFAGLVSPPRRVTVLGGELSAFSTSPSQLQEVTLDVDFNALSRSPMHGSPSQGRTMKEYEDQLAALRKENFNLKLRVYFLEERLTASNAPANQDDLFKKNIELKVSLESLRRECNEKKDLLCAAARALETVEATAARKESELNAHNNRLQEQLEMLREAANGMKCQQKAIVAMECHAGGISTEADDSVALYATAFNLRPTPKEIKALHDKAHSDTAPCECHQLRTLLASERDASTQLRQSLTARDQVISQQIRQIQGLIHRSKSPVKRKSEPGNPASGELVRRVKTPDSIDLENDDDDQTKVERLQQENKNAIQMIQSCLVRIKHMSKESNKMKASLQRREERIAQLHNQSKRAGLQFPLESSKSATDYTSGDSEANDFQHYTDIIIQKDNKITELEQEIRSLIMSKASEAADNSSQSEDKDWSWMDNHLENKLISLRESICKVPKQKSNENAIVEMSPIDEVKSKDVEHKNVQEMLASRLTEMACFLDTLLSHRCVLGEEKRKKVKSLMEQSLELPVGLKLDPEASRVLEDTFADVTFGNMSQSFRIEDLTRLLGHHTTLDDSCGVRIAKYARPDEEERAADEATIQSVVLRQRAAIERLSSQLHDVRSRCICATTAAEDSDDKFLSADLKYSIDTGKLPSRKTKVSGRRAGKSQLNSTWHGTAGMGADRSESECWSEPDRGVSLARMGRLAGDPKSDRSLSSEDDSPRLHDHHGETDAFVERLTRERDSAEKLLEEANARIEDLQQRLEVGDVEAKKNFESIDALTRRLNEAEERLTRCDREHEEVLIRLGQDKTDVENRLARAIQALGEEREKTKVQAEAHLRRTREMTDAFDQSSRELKAKMEAEWVSKSRYDALRKEADGAALQASQASLDRHVAAEQRMRSDAEAERLARCLADARLRHSELESHCAQLQNKVVHLECWRSDVSRCSDSPVGASPSPPRAPSPDQGIDSDRLSSLEMVESGASNDDLVSSDMATQNVILNERLSRLQRRYEAAVMQIKEADSRKKMVHKAICQEIHKTRSVLRQARDNFRSDP